MTFISSFLHFCMYFLSNKLFLILCRMQLNTIAPLNAQHINRQHLFQQRSPSADCNYSTTTTTTSATQPSSDNLPSSLYAPIVKTKASSRKPKNNVEDREYIDIPLPQSVIAYNMQNDHETNCSRYNFLLHNTNNSSTKNNIIKEHYESNECICRDRLEEENSR